MLEILLTLIFLGLTQIVSPNPVFQIIILVTYLILISPSLYTFLKGPPFVPSTQKTIQNAIKLSLLKPTDIVYDLGCGDGRFLIAASPYCKQAIGYEASLLTFLLAKFRTRRHSNITIKFSNFWKTDLSQANVIFCFLLKPLMQDVESTIWPQLKANTRLISNTFKLPSIQPTQVLQNVLLYKK